MELVGIIIIFSLGILVGYRVRSRATVSHSPRSETPVSVRVLGVANEVETEVEQSAQPGDALNIDKFKQAVGWLSDTQVAVSEVRDLATGANFIASCIALAALHDRNDSAPLVAELRGQVPHSYAWPLFFLLRFLSRHSQEPLIGAVVLQVQEWWTDNAHMQRIVREFVEHRIQAGEQPGFGNQLDGASQEQIQATREMLKHLRNDARTPLEAELRRWQNTRIDEARLNKVGRFLSNQDLDQWRPGSERIEQYKTG